MKTKTPIRHPPLWVLAIVLLFMGLSIYSASQPEIHLIQLTRWARPGQMATITARGKPFTTYDIKVAYWSGNSTAAGLYPKQSDRFGYVSWSWRVGGATTKGEWPITIAGGWKRLRTSFIVI